MEEFDVRIYIDVDTRIRLLHGLYDKRPGMLVGIVISNRCCCDTDLEPIATGGGEDKRDMGILGKCSLEGFWVVKLVAVELYQPCTGQKPLLPVSIFIAGCQATA